MEKRGQNRRQLTSCKSFARALLASKADTQSALRSCLMVAFPELQQIPGWRLRRVNLMLGQ
jgi:hypothetical protein